MEPHPQPSSPMLSSSRKREKPILSCSFCRGRKLRCDRQSPCGACIRRNQAADCTYLSSESDRIHAVDYRPRTRGQQARQRVARLESLISEMVEKSAQSVCERSKPTSTPNPSAQISASAHDVRDNIGILSLDDDHVVYTGSSHWATFLEEIQGLKDDLSIEPQNTTADADSSLVHSNIINESGPQTLFLLNNVSPVTRDQILAMLPPKRVVDRHVSHFFNSFDMAPFIIHRKTFLAEYAVFWVNPAASPVMWIGLLYSIMTMSEFLQRQGDTEKDDMVDSYRSLTIHCLLAGDYMQSSRYTMETLILHFAVEQNLNLDASIKSYILFGVIMRIALRMGLHRDPSHWPEIRPLRAELRRRLWITLYQMDFFTSTQVGLPRIIKDTQCDTQPPAHLFENDLDAEHENMPAERPVTESSPWLYIIQRDKVIKVAAEVYDATEAGPPSAADIAVLSTKLDRAVDSIPTLLKYDTLEAAITDNPLILLHQMILDMLIRKAIYLLHRWSLVKGPIDGANSSQICVDAALAILAHQRRMHEETQPGGLFFSIRWKVTTPLNHEFLQATMMLCFVLSRSEKSHGNRGDAHALSKRNEIQDTLISSKALWEKSFDQSAEAQRASKAISAALAAISGQIPTSGSINTIPGVPIISPLGTFELDHTMILDEQAYLGINGNALEFTDMIEGFMIGDHSNSWL